jgi:hypothetical protein
MSLPDSAMTPQQEQFVRGIRILRPLPAFQTGPVTSPSQKTPKKRKLSPSPLLKKSHYVPYLRNPYKNLSHPLDFQGNFPLSFFGVKNRILNQSLRTQASGT